jgi:cystathionine beta-lyase
MIKVEGQSLAQLHTRTSEKWTGSEPDVLPMPVAEMDFEIDQSIKDRLHALVDNSDTGYLGSTKELEVNLATFAKNRWNWEIDPDFIYTCGDVGIGMSEPTRMVVQPGEKIMINTPVYMNMRNWANRVLAEVVDAPMLKNGMHFTLDFEAIEAGYRSGVKIHYLCNPHNPTGTVFSSEELSRLADLAYKYGVMVFSDEIHGPIAYESSAFVPFLSVSEAARSVGIAVTSASKAWNLAGLKCAQIITADPKMKEMIDSMPKSVRFSASLFGSHANAVAYTATEWLDAAIVTLDRNRRFLERELSQKLPTVDYRIPDASYLGWLDISSLNLGEDPSAAILEKGRLLVSNGILFGPDSQNFVRINFACSEEVISEGVNRLSVAAQGSPGGNGNL